MEHIELLCDISELNWVFSDSSSIEDFLQKIVVMTARHMKTDVCSIYLYDPKSNTLVLKATHGLNIDLINKVRMKLGEGITGLALKELRTICDNQGSKHPSYKYFNDLDEDQYEAFLGVPIIHGIEKVGVLVVQRKSGQTFKTEDISTLHAVTNQLANIIENARVLISLKDAQADNTVSVHTEPIVKTVKGKSASTGYAFGPAKIEIKSRALESLAVKAKDGHHGLQSFEKAVERTRTHLNKRRQAVEERLSDAASLIFTAHLMLLQDDLFHGRIVDRINEGASAEKAILETANYYISLFSAKDDPYLREKADDIRDLSIRLLENVIGIKQYHSSYNGRIIIAHDLLPSDILILSSEGVAGIILVAGGVTSHLSVLARSLGLPLIITDEPQLLELPDGTPVLLDGETGNVYVNPGKEITDPFESQNRTMREAISKRATVSDRTFTQDNSRITIYANINLLSDIKVANEFKCEGVGLYRTEFPFLIRSAFPTEEEQIIVYKKLIDGMKGKPIIFRTLDIGGDKILPYFDHFNEQNPFLGLRSIRFTLRNRDVFRQQIRAILRAGYGADLRIMFPMISTVEELKQAKTLVADCISELEKEKTAINAVPQIGMMIEIPAVVEIIETLAQMTDFLSIGTNDFIQYMLAVDRTNEKVASLYLPHHPSVLRSLARITRVALSYNKPVSVCGDMAHQPEYIPFLLGIGIRNLSVDAPYIPRIQKCISSISVKQAGKLASSLLKASSEHATARLLGL